jgi:carbon-monoxide dehydrogenase medium subunit
MYSFNYVRPQSVADAASQLVKSSGSRVLAGGQTLIPAMKQRLAQIPALIDLGQLAELRGIDRNGNAIGIGAMTTHAEIATSQVVKATIPSLARLADGIGDAQVRHRGTLGGSLANNDPASDYPAAVLALNGTIVTNKRTVTADDFFKGLFTTALGDGEIITAVGFPAPERAAYVKFEQRASRFALVGVFVAKTGAGVRVAVTGAGAGGVFRQTDMEKALAASFTADALKAVTAKPAGLISDMHGSADYRANLIGVLARRAVAAAAA